MYLFTAEHYPDPTGALACAHVDSETFRDLTSIAPLSATGGGATDAHRTPFGGINLQLAEECEEVLRDD